MKQAAVIVGASSGLGRALATALASSGVDIVLAARSERDLHAIGSDLTIRYKIAVKVLPIDTQQLNEAKGAEFVEKCFSAFPHVNQVYLTAAIVDDADAGEKSLLLVRRMQETNFIGIAYLIVPFGNRLIQTQSTIVVVSTIAAIRPRSNNMAYASSKISLEY